MKANTKIRLVSILLFLSLLIMCFYGGAWSASTYFLRAYITTGLIMGLVCVFRMQKIVNHHDIQTTSQALFDLSYNQKDGTTVISFYFFPIMLTSLFWPIWPYGMLDVVEDN